MKGLIYASMKTELQAVLQQILKDMGIADVTPEVSISDDAVHGDYTTNIAMRLAKPLKKSPMEIALQVKNELDKRISAITHDDGVQKKSNNIQTVSEKRRKGSKLQDNELTISSLRNILERIERVDIAPPGFLNLILRDSSLSTQIERVLKQGESYGTAHTDDAEKKTVMVEYTDPNPFKEFHIGHLYSNAVGESVARLHEAIGWKVIRVDYFGDVGMHVAKSIWGLRTKMRKEGVNLADLSKKPLPDRVKYLGMSYSVGASIYEEEGPDAQKAKEEMKDINYMVYLAAQEYMQKTLHWAPQVDYRQYVTMEGGLYDEVKTLFETGRSWSMEYFETIFRRLGTHFDDYYPESIVGEYGARIVHEHIGDVFEESDGAIVFRGAHTRVFLNSLGLPTYEAKELGLNWKKSQDYRLDKSYIVTGNEINEYFHVVLAAMSKVVPEAAAKTTHIGHGMVRLPEGKMSSRTGKIISGEWLLEEVKRSVYDLLKQNKSEYTKEEQDDIAEKAAIAAIKYSMLRVSLPANIAFDFSTSLSFDGDSGPYLLYSYARCKSVLRKASGQSAEFQGSALNLEERELARAIYFFPEIVAEAAATLSPNVLCSYLFKLAQAFNLFYQKHAILGKPERLALTAATAQVLKNGLHLLGIATAERM